MEASKRNLDEDKLIGERNVETIKDTRNKFFSRLLQAMDREETIQTDNRNSLASRFRGVKELFRNASRRDAQRRHGGFD